MTRLIPSVLVRARDCAERAREVRGRRTETPGFERAVRTIIDGVRTGGDLALVRFVKKFDGVSRPPRSLRVPQGELDRAARKIEPGLARAIRFSMERIRRVQETVKRSMAATSRYGGFTVKVVPTPLSAVGCYVPGGRAAYASSVLMTAGVARLAGVERIVLCSPLQRDGRVDSAVLAAAKAAGVREVYGIGGAHAVAALAYGTRSIKPVQKIVGPGGRYVAAAKRMVSADVETDFFAGPTELVVFADDSCEPRIAAWDMIGQAEHGEDSVIGLVTRSERYASRVRSEMERILPTVRRRDYVEACLTKGFAAVCPEERAARGFIDALAPEHLEIMTERPGRDAAAVTGAGLKLVGRYSPCAASDYAVGTDHVIPTGGFSSLRGCLSVLDFMKLDWTVTGSRKGLLTLLPPVKELTRAEGLPNHYLSMESRFRN